MDLSQIQSNPLFLDMKFILKASLLTKMLSAILTMLEEPRYNLLKLIPLAHFSRIQSPLLTFSLLTKTSSLETMNAEVLLL
jgi:hypothetical protein